MQICNILCLSGGQIILLQIITVMMPKPKASERREQWGAGPCNAETAGAQVSFSPRNNLRLEPASQVEHL